MIQRGFQPAFTTGVVSPALAARIDLQKYDSAAKRLDNVVVRPEGGATKAMGTRFVADTGIEDGPVRLLPFSFSVTQNYVLEISAGRIRIATRDGIVKDADDNPVEVESPYGAEDLFALSYAQSADVVYFAHAKYAPRKLMRRDHDDWSMEEVSFAPKTATPGGVSVWWSVGSVTGPTRTWRYVVTAINADTGEESLPSAPVSVSGSESMRVGILQNGEPIADWYAILGWTLVDGANEYRIYKEVSSDSGMYGYIGSATSNRFSDRNIAPNAEDTPPVDYNPFDDENHPSKVAIYQQRLVFGNSDKFPNTLWMSRTGNFENFTKGMRVKDDDYVEATLASRQVNPISWIVGQRSLLTGTMGAAWEITGGGGNGAITPGGIGATVQSARGSAKDLQPALIDNAILFVSRIGDAVRDLKYYYSNDGYAGTNRALFASHLFVGRKVKEVSYQESPWSVVWFVMTDGVLLGLTWMEDHEIFAWHRHETDGAYESVCVIPGDDQDDPFFVVRREVNGKTVRYIERMESPFVVPDNYGELDDEAQRDVLARAFFVHSGLSYEGEAKKTFTGLEHLEGKTLAVLADGAVQPPVTVRDGEITLKKAYSVVHAGLPYRAQIDTVNFEPAQEDGTSLGKRRRVARVAAKFQDSSGVSVGINGKTIQPKQRSNEPFGLPPRLRSGTFTYAVPGPWDADSSVTFISDDPLPFTILTVVPEVSVGE